MVKTFICVAVVLILSGCERDNVIALKEVNSYLRTMSDSTYYNEDSLEFKAIDILENIDTVSLCKKEKYYYEILDTEARYKAGLEKDSISIIEDSYPHYSFPQEWTRLKYVRHFLNSFYKFQNGEYINAMKDAMIALSIANENMDYYWCAKSSQLIADNLSFNRNWEQAVNQDSITIRYFKKAGRHRDAMFAEVELASDLSGSGRYKESKALFKRLFDITSTSSVDTLLLTYIVNNAALCMTDQNDLEEAKKYFQIIEKTKSINEFSSSYYYALFTLAINEKDVSSATHYLSKIKVNDQEGSDYVRFLLAKSQIKALHHEYQEALTLRDSADMISDEIVHNNLTQSVVAAQRDIYNTRAEEEALKAREARLLLVVIIIITALIIFAGIVFYRYRIRLKNLKVREKISQIFEMSRKLDILAEENDGLTKAMDKRDDELNSMERKLNLNLLHLEEMKKEISIISEEYRAMEAEKHVTEKSLLLKESDLKSAREELEQSLEREKDNNRKIKELFQSRYDFFNKFSNLYLIKKDSPNIKKTLIADFEKMMDEMKKSVISGKTEEMVNRFMNDIVTELAEKCKTLSAEDLLMTTLIYAGFMPRFISEVCGYSPNYFYVKKTRIIQKIIKALPAEEAEKYINKLNEKK